MTWTGVSGDEKWLDFEYILIQDLLTDWIGVVKGLKDDSVLRSFGIQGNRVTGQ